MNIIIQGTLKQGQANYYEDTRVQKRGIKSFFQKKIEEDKKWQASTDALLVSCCWCQLTKAAEDVVEVVEIIIAFLQNCFVAIGDVDQSVGVSHCAGAEKQSGDR